jgi:hypothetical protein
VTVAGSAFWPCAASIIAANVISFIMPAPEMRVISGARDLGFRFGPRVS